MYAGMNRREMQALLLLTAVIAVGVGAHSMLRTDAGAEIWIDRDESLALTDASSGGGLWQNAKPAGPLDLNRATAEELAAALPLVGATRARAIVEHRESHGPFSKPEALLDVSGIGPGIWERVQTLVYVDSPDGGDEPAATGEPAPGPGRASESPGDERAAPRDEQAAPDDRIDINTADEKALQMLWNVGAKRAEAIVIFRREHGPFRTPEDLVRVPGIGPKTLERNRDRICVR